MKYFTADLLHRFGSEEPSRSSAGLEEWERTCEHYNAYLDSVKGVMSSGLKQIIDRYYLHDAKVLGMGKQGPFFVVMLQLDTPPHLLLALTISLTSEPTTNPAALPAELCSTGQLVEWQYDEIELVDSESQLWSWSILLSNGWEVVLSFRDVQVHEVQAWIPAPRNGDMIAAPSAQSAKVP
jgi:hypothetical protein